MDTGGGGESSDDFLDGFPSVRREQVVAAEIEAGKLKILEAVQPTLRLGMVLRVSG